VAFICAHVKDSERPVNMIYLESFSLKIPTCKMEVNIKMNFYLIEHEDYNIV
jgi:hypothetical protein